MKIDYFYGNIAIREKDGYWETLSFNLNDKTKGLVFRYPYGDATPEEAEAISQFTKTVTNAYNKLTTQIDNVNRDMRLEQYAEPSAEELKAIAAAKLSAAQELELIAKSASPQTCALGDGEVSTGDKSLIREGFQELDADMR